MKRDKNIQKAYRNEIDLKTKAIPNKKKQYKIKHKGKQCEQDQ